MVEDQSMNLTDAKRQFSKVATDIRATGRRILLKKRGAPFVGLVSAADLRRLEQLDVQADALSRSLSTMSESVVSGDSQDRIDDEPTSGESD
jgi:prevent-host-death family protein